MIFYPKVERDISQTCLFLVLVGKTALFAAKISSSVKVANKTAVAWIFLRVNWRAWIFFHLLFPCANVLFVLHPPPPHKFSNGPSLNQNRYGTYLVHIKFRVLKCHSLDIRIETFHGSLIRQWEVNSIHQLFFSVVCQLLSKHILATFCDNDVARSCNYFLNTNCDTLLFYFFL